jgi:hypothetical protein
MEAFHIEHQQLHDLYQLSTSFERVVAAAQDPRYSLIIDPYDPDKAGAYFQGTRCYLRDNDKVDLYIYFGLMFNDRKGQVGLFAEVDRLNNRKFYEQIVSRIEPDGHYVLNTSDDGFIKLFMTDADTDCINEAADSEEQDRLFADFLRSCCLILISKAR